jgi:hypothetical protein
MQVIVILYILVSPAANKESNLVSTVLDIVQVPLSDVWLSTCISEVSEVTLDPTTSFVIGWPINNAVITFG